MARETVWRNGVQLTRYTDTVVCPSCGDEHEVETLVDEGLARIGIDPQLERDWRIAQRLRQCEDEQLDALRRLRVA